MTTLSGMNVRTVWPSVAQKANATMPMMTTRGLSLQWQRITQPRTVRLRILPRTNSSPHVVKVRKRFWAGAHHHFRDHLSRWRTATRLRTTNAASRRRGQAFIVSKEPVVKFPSEQNTIASTESSANSNTKQSRSTFDRFARNWKELWRLRTWEDSTNFSQNLEFTWKDFHDEAWSPTVYNKSRPTSRSWAATLTGLQTLRLNKGYHSYRVTTRWIRRLTMQRFFTS